MTNDSESNIPSNKMTAAEASATFDRLENDMRRCVSRVLAAMREQGVPRDIHDREAGELDELITTQMAQARCELGLT